MRSEVQVYPCTFGTLDESVELNENMKYNKVQCSVLTSTPDLVLHHMWLQEEEKTAD